MNMPRAGVTLVELIVVLAILSVVAGVTTLAFRRADTGPSVPLWVSAITQARRVALDSARTVSLTVRVGDSVYAATALPDGSVVADPRLGIDRLTGEVPHAP
jgi:prepilin-type N-terminal cleavage/methylation domain-containing protein